MLVIYNSISLVDNLKELQELKQRKSELFTEYIPRNCSNLPSDVKINSISNNSINRTENKINFTLYVNGKKWDTFETPIRFLDRKEWVETNHRMGIDSIYSADRLHNSSLTFEYSGKNETFNFGCNEGWNIRLIGD